MAKINERMCGSSVVAMDAVRSSGQAFLATGMPSDVQTVKCELH